MRGIITTILMAMLLGLAMTVHAAGQPGYYRKWAELPSKVLLDKGSRYAELENQADSAFVCFTIVAGRYSKDMGKDEKHMCIVAYIGKWYVCFFNFFDYAKASENLQRAQEIAEENGENLCRIYLNYGCMFQTIAEQSDDRRSGMTAIDYYKRSLSDAMAAGDGSTATMAMDNLCLLCAEYHCIDSIADEIGSYTKVMKTKVNNSAYNYTLLLYAGLQSMERGDAQKAISIFEKQKSCLNDSLAYSRYRYGINCNMAKAYATMGDYPKAIELMTESEKIAEAFDIKDMKLEVYRLMAEYFRLMKHDRETEEYRNRFFRLKDTLLNYRQVAGVQEIKFMEEMRYMDEHIAQLNREKHMQSILTWAVVIIALVVAGFVYVLWRNNRRLRQANNTLYENNLEILRHEERERQRHKEQEQRQPNSETTHELQEEKRYKGSLLDETDKQEIEAKILDAIETSEEVYSADFSADRLAELTGINYRYLSQVINELHGTNFNGFINEYRVKEACKRFNDVKHYGNYTVEAIANSVGFRSRSAFSTIFKKSTGLSPSEYQRIARRKE